MKRLLFICLPLLVACGKVRDRKMEVLDSLRGQFADKEIHIILDNNEARSTPLSSKYAYTDKEKSDLAFELKPNHKFKLSYEEGLMFVKTIEEPERNNPEMLLIENLTLQKRGFVSYKFVKEFYNVPLN